MKTIEEFLKEYDDGTLMFPRTNYREGARITCSFGLESGYTLQPDKSLLFDTVRIHTGVDRSAIYNKNGSRIRNVVYSPFNFNRSNMIYYGPGTSYGNLIQLFNDDYGFEMRIAHMDPNLDILPEAKLKLDKKEPINRDTFLGQAGNFGVSGGAHTHTEFISINETCPILDNILLKKYGNDSVALDYSDAQIFGIYQNKTLWFNKTLNQMKEHYQSLKKERKILSLNKYKYVFKDPNTEKVRTRYSSESLFNGL